MGKDFLLAYFLGTKNSMEYSLAISEKELEMDSPSHNDKVAPLVLLSLLAAVLGHLLVDGMVCPYSTFAITAVSFVLHIGFILFQGRASKQLVASNRDSKQEMLDCRI